LCIIGEMVHFQQTRLMEFGNKFSYLIFRDGDEQSFDYEILFYSVHHSLYIEFARKFVSFEQYDLPYLMLTVWPILLKLVKCFPFYGDPLSHIRL
jgi:hypothetical protein